MSRATLLTYVQVAIVKSMNFIARQESPSHLMAIKISSKFVYLILRRIPIARIRTLKPEFWESEKAGRMSILARLTFLGLISLADDAGRGRADIGFLRGRLHPYSPEIDARLMSESLQEIENVGLVLLYEGLDGCSFYHLPGFLDNQRIDKPSPSKLPPPSKKHSKMVPRTLQEHSKNVLGSIGEEGKGREGKGKELAAAPQPPEVIAPKPKTGIQKVMCGFKEAKGIHSDDAEWDAKHFKRFARPAADLLKIFDGNAEAAIVYTLKKGAELDAKQFNGWGLEAVARAAATDPLVTNLSGGDDEQPSAVDTSHVGRNGRFSAPTSARSLAGEALRSIEQSIGRTKGPSLDGPGMDEPLE